ncbi:hypothetical protein BCR42DRAFT_345381 [Absidia repens]|uniref:Uncharacterized protein n=1 Tax=Absidia repens TaxID=90262 RepID=A0A1X2IUM5_9FUNG|nr:hypothetical protein BCR42DRAFT_345381 [Absidia repens]
MTTIHNERFLPSLISYPMNILTVQDVILDSPAFRSHIEQVADQSERFEKWLDNFVRAFKSYLDSLSKANAQTSHLYKQLIPDKKDHAFISNSHVAALSVNGFANALKCSLSAKVKLVNDLDETLLQPLQNLLKSDLKEFKDMRRTFEKTLDKYENHLSRYGNLSKQKEPSALREDAFQMFDIQKSYVRASGTYFMQLATLKSKVEHLLVDSFSGALTDHLDYHDESLLSQNSARGVISGWRQWLEESKATCSYQLDRIQNSTQALEEVYIRQIRPHRSLKRYSTSNNDQLVAITNSSTIESLSDDCNKPDSSYMDRKMGSSTSLPPSTSFGDIHTSLLVNQSSSTSSSTSTHSSGATQSSCLTKQGYLFSRVVVGKPSRYSWVRRWFFLKDGWFGQYTVSTVNKVKGTMTISTRISVNNKCECRVFTDIDRRFCFEVTGFQSSFFLQAESEQDMQQWLWAIEKAKDIYEKQHTIDSDSVTDVMDIPRALLSPKATASVRKSANNSQLLVSLSVSPPIIPSSTGIPTINPSPLASDYLMNDMSTTSALTTLMIIESNQSAIISATNDSDDTNSKALADSISENRLSLPGANKSSGSNSSQQQPPVRRHHSTSTAASWSVPWLMSGINALSSNGADLDSSSLDGGVLKSSNIQDNPGAYVIWPNKVEMDAPKVILDNYSEELATGQRELRRYFANVPKEETVLEVFSASLYRQSRKSGVDSGDKNRDNDNDGMNAGNYHNGGQNLMHTGNGYSGTIYMTQKRLWFYSCRMMTCVNAAVISLNSIRSIRLEKVLSGKSQGMLMYIDTKLTPSTTYCFGLWLEVAELIAERLRVVTQNAKKAEKMDDQSLFDIVRRTTIGKIRPKTPTSQLIATSTSNAAVTPVTVQAQSRLTTEPQPNLDNTGNEDMRSSPSPSAASSFSDNSLFSAARITMERQQQNASPAAGALTAAMEAANEARAAAKSKTRLTKKNSKSDMEDNNSTASSLTDGTLDKNGKQSSQHPIESKTITAITSKSSLLEPVTCNCDDHLEKTEADLELPTSALKLYQFISNLSCWDQLNKSKGNSGPTTTEWLQNKTGTTERTLNYLMPNPMVKSKEAEVIEIQQILKNDDGLCYVIMITTKTPTLPYADAFIPMIKLCITYTSPTTCRLICNIGVKWLKSIMVKGMVNRAAFKGMSDTISALIPIIEQAASQDKDNTTSGTIEQQRQQKAANKIKSAVKEQGTINDTHLVKQNGDTNQERKMVKPNILSGTTLSPQDILIFVGVALLLFIYRMCITEWANSSIATSSPSMGKISWRAVHLTDLEPLVNGEVTEMDRRNSSTYQTFKTFRSDVDGGWDYRWFNIRYRLIAAELTFTREQLAVIRYELLTAFKMLNGMEQRLMESEYWTYLLDQRSRCDMAALGRTDDLDGRRRQQQPDFSHLLLCNEINDELNHI